MGLLKTRSAVTSVQYSTKGAGNVYHSPQNHSEELNNMIQRYLWRYLLKKFIVLQRIHDYFKTVIRNCSSLLFDKKASIVLHTNHSEELTKYILLKIAIAFLSLRDHFKTVIYNFFCFVFGKNEAKLYRKPENLWTIQKSFKNTFRISVNVLLKYKILLKNVWVLQSCDLQLLGFDIQQ